MGDAGEGARTHNARDRPQEVSDSALTASLVSALEVAAEQETEVRAALVSVTIEMLRRGDAQAFEASLVRKTRTLVFMRAEARNAAGDVLATASSVHKLPGA